MYIATVFAKNDRITVLAFEVDDASVQTTLTFEDQLLFRRDDELGVVCQRAPALDFVCFSKGCMRVMGFSPTPLLNTLQGLLHAFLQHQMRGQ
jgi:hypothetical protein